MIKQWDIEGDITRLMVLLNENLRHFPTYEKYGLCQEIRRHGYEMFGLIAAIKKKYHNKTQLVNLDTTHESLRMLNNVAFELGYYECVQGKPHRSKEEAQRKYMIVAVRIDNIGKQIGALMKEVK